MVEDNIDLEVKPSGTRKIAAAENLIDNHDSSATISQEKESSINETQHDNKSGIDDTTENIQKEKNAVDFHCTSESENKEIETTENETETESEAVVGESSNITETEDSQPEDTSIDSLGISKTSSSGESPSKKGASKRKNLLPKMHFQQQQQTQPKADKGRSTRKTRQTRTRKRRKKGKQKIFKFFDYLKDK